MKNEELKSFFIICRDEPEIVDNKNIRALGVEGLRLLDENTAMRGALEWYADPKHWTIDYVEGNLGDWGNRARACINKLGERT